MSNKAACLSRIDRLDRDSPKPTAKIKPMLVLFQILAISLICRSGFGVIKKYWQATQTKRERRSQSGSAFLVYRIERNRISTYRPRIAPNIRQTCRITIVSGKDQTAYNTANAQHWSQISSLGTETLPKLRLSFFIKSIFIGNHFRIISWLIP